MDLNDITVIVPTKNEADNIERFLDAVPPGIPIIVVDASSDNTLEIIERKSRRFLYTIRDRGNIATARQIAAEHACTRWLLYSDSDVAFDRRYFQILSELRLGSRFGAVYGAKLSLDRYRCYYYFFCQWMRMCNALGVPAASGSNMLVRRRALLEVGGFDGGLGCNEDTELILRIQRGGFQVAYHGELKVYEFDHRRLDQGVLRKTAHSLTRGVLLFFGLHGVLRQRDWGYWPLQSADKLE